MKTAKWRRLSCSGVFIVNFEQVHVGWDRLSMFKVFNENTSTPVAKHCNKEARVTSMVAVLVSYFVSGVFW